MKRRLLLKVTLAAMAGVTALMASADRHGNPPNFPYPPMPGIPGNGPHNPGNGPHNPGNGPHNPGYPGGPGPYNPGYPGGPGPSFPYPPMPGNGPYNPGPNFPYPPFPNQPPISREIVTTQVNRWFQYGEILPVREVLGLNSYYNNRDVGFVTFNGQSYNNMGQAELLVNGYNASYPQNVDTMGRTYRFDLPQYQNTLGRDIQTLQIRFSGQVYVREVTAEIIQGRRN